MTAETVEEWAVRREAELRVLRLCEAILAGTYGDDDELPPEVVPPL